MEINFFRYIIVSTMKYDYSWLELMGALKHQIQRKLTVSNTIISFIIGFIQYIGK